MKSIITLHATPNAWLTKSVLAPHLDAFIAYLQLGRYAAKTTRSYLGGIAHFAYWMTQNNLPVQVLDEHTVEQFLIDHLPRCDCPKPVMRTYRDLRAALGHLLRVLRQQGVIAELSIRNDYIAEELQRYDQYMFMTRGLSTSTRSFRLCTAQRLLLYKFSSRAIVFEELEPTDVRQFIAARLQLVNTISYASALASALRAYFRYRTTCGDSVHDLLGVIASPAHWNLASLPRALKVDWVSQRDHLLLGLLYNTGARVSEIIGVHVADVVLDTAACVHLHGKGRKLRSVPLWRSMVKEIRAWLKLNPKLGPSSALLPNREGEVMTRDNVAKRLALAVRRAAKDKAALSNRHISPHTIRHTTAMNLLQSGVDISVIALWLGHESPTTTHQYVEADLAMKERALARLQEPDVNIRRYHAPDSLLEFLKTL